MANDDNMSRPQSSLSNSSAPRVEPSEIGSSQVASSAGVASPLSPYRPKDDQLAMPTCGRLRKER